MKNTHSPIKKQKIAKNAYKSSFETPCASVIVALPQEVLPPRPKKTNYRPCHLCSLANPRPELSHLLFPDKLEGGRRFNLKPKRSRRNELDELPYFYDIQFEKKRKPLSLRLVWKHPSDGIELGAATSTSANPCAETPIQIPILSDSDNELTSEKNSKSGQINTVKTSCSPSGLSAFDENR